MQAVPWQAFIYSKADGKKIRQTFPTRAAAKAWRDDKLGAVKRGELRTPTSTTIREAAEAFLAGARDGSIPTASGGSLQARHAPRLHGRAQ